MPEAHQPLAAVVGQFVRLAADQGRDLGLMACASSARAPLRKTSVSQSAKVPGWESWKTLPSVTSYHFFGGEVEAPNTPTACRLNRFTSSPTSGHSS
jgi:hypothetical protein